MLRLVLLFCISCLGLSQLKAEERIYDISQLVEFSKNQNLELQTEKFVDQINDAEYKRIMKEFNPKLDLQFGAGPVSKETGNPLRSESDYSSWGVAFLAEADFTWPIHTWGRRELVLEAMKHKKKVDSQNIVLKKNEIIYKLKEAYYQTLYTYSLLDIVNDIHEKITEKKNGKKIKKVEKYELDILESQIESKKEDILKGQMLAFEAVKLYSGVNESFQLDRDYIEKEERELQEFDYYWDLANSNKPEFIQLSEGIQAKTSYMESQKKERYPVLGVLIQYEFSQASNTEKQQSTFAYDPYNKNDFSMGIGFKWNIDFGVTDENIRKTGAELQQLKRKKMYADNGLKLLLKKSWQEVSTATKKMQFARRGYKSGKKWVNRLASSWSMGLTPTKKLVEAYQTYAFASKEYYDAILNHHLAWAKLSQEVGVEVDPLFLSEVKN